MKSGLCAVVTTTRQALYALKLSLGPGDTKAKHAGRALLLVKGATEAVDGPCKTRESGETLCLAQEDSALATPPI